MLEYYMMYGKEMKMDKNAINYFTCTEYYYNNVPVGFALIYYSDSETKHTCHSSFLVFLFQQYYIKLGCISGAGKGFQISAYTDSYCTVKASSTAGQQIYSYLANTVDMSSFKTNFDYCQACIVEKNYVVAQYAKLCSAVNNYKQTCDRNCMKAAQDKTNKQSVGFSTTGKVFLFFFSFTGKF